MAHEFFKGIYGNNTPAWHGLGEVFPGLLTIEDAIQRSGVDFGITKVAIGFRHPITGNWVEVDDNIGVFGADELGDHGLVGIHGDGYELDGFGDHFRSLGFEQPVVESCVLLRKGKIAVMSIRLPELDLVLPDGSNLRSVLHAYSSHDGTYAITLKDGSYRLECANMLRAADADGSGRVWRIKHSAAKNELRRNAVVAATYAQERADYHAAQCEKLLAVKLSPIDVDRIMYALIPQPVLEVGDSTRSLSIAENKRDAIKAIYVNAPDMQGIQGTAWGIVQAVGQYVDHFKNYKSGRNVADADKARSRDENRFITTAITGNTLADRVMELVAA